MASEFEHCSNCKRDVNASNYVLHTAYCLRNIQLCSLCEEPVQRSDMTQHLEDKHTIDDCPLCSVTMEKWQLEKHRDTCCKRPVSCTFCEIEISMDDLAQHVETCGSRTEFCHPCKKYIMLKDKECHAGVCLKNRPIAANLFSPSLNSREYTAKFASSSDVTNNIFSKRRPVDGNIFSSSLSSQKDNEKISYSNATNDISSKEAYSRREISCKFCHRNLPVQDITEHTERCGYQTELCSICHKLIMFKDRDNHSDVCPEKSSLVKNLFSVFDLKTSNKESGYATSAPNKTSSKGISSNSGECHICHQLIPWIDMNVHIPCCASASDKCSRCGISVPESELKEHVLKLCPRLSTEKSGSKGKASDGNVHLPHSKIKTGSTSCPMCHQMFHNSLIFDHIRICPEAGNKNAKEVHTCTLCQEKIPVTEKQNHETFYCKVRNEIAYEDLCSSSRDFSLAERNEMHEEDFESQKNSLEKDVEICPSCQGKIPKIRLKCHLEFCMKNAKPCKFCAEAIPKDSERKHLEVCIKKSEPGFQYKNRSRRSYADITKNDHDHSEPSQTGRNRSEKVAYDITKCVYCKISYNAVVDPTHMEKCYANISECSFCGAEVVKSNFEFHEKGMCQQYEAYQKGDYGSRSQRRNKKRNKNAESGKNEANSWKNLLFGNGGQANETKRPFGDQSGPVGIPCEFCEKTFPFEFIVEHQSGCRPDLVHFPRGQNDESSKAAAECDNEINDQRMRREMTKREYLIKDDSPSESHVKPVNISEEIIQGRQHVEKYHQSTKQIRPLNISELKDEGNCFAGENFSFTRHDKQQYIRSEAAEEHFVEKGDPNITKKLEQLGFQKPIGAERASKRNLLQISRFTKVKPDILPGEFLQDYSIIDQDKRSSCGQMTNGKHSLKNNYPEYDNSNQNFNTSFEGDLESRNMRLSEDENKTCMYAETKRNGLKEFLEKGNEYLEFRKKENELSELEKKKSEFLELEGERDVAVLKRHFFNFSVDDNIIQPTVQNTDIKAPYQSLVQNVHKNANTQSTPEQTYDTRQIADFDDLLSSNCKDENLDEVLKYLNLKQDEAKVYDSSKANNNILLSSATLSNSSCCNLCGTNEICTCGENERLPSTDDEYISADEEYTSYFAKGARPKNNAHYSDQYFTGKNSSLAKESITKELCYQEKCTNQTGKRTVAKYCSVAEERNADSWTQWRKKSSDSEE